jgi:hypothetical protein
MVPKANPGTLEVEEKSRVPTRHETKFFIARTAASILHRLRHDDCLQINKKLCVLVSPFITGLLQRVSVSKVQNEETESKCSINEIFGPKT